MHAGEFLVEVDWGREAEVGVGRGILTCDGVGEGFWDFKFSSDNCISVDADIERRRVDDDEADNMLLVEVGVITVKANLIVVRGNEAIMPISMLPSAIEY
ncbi:hypothetical protein B296_00009010 [Ensete ventricosum]|uniref:Uncharacterized protein n=1 Tax=Ensete ventricosum TaxID=4639 RepID=A0A427B2C2_ENSVE|nr:hypothetical protein B296_00009010 [Ensete ventricosum]